MKNDTPLLSLCDKQTRAEVFRLSAQLIMAGYDITPEQILQAAVSELLASPDALYALKEKVAKEKSR